MEDAATAEIARSQLWQWARHGVRLSDGTTVTREMVRRAIDEAAEELEGMPNLQVARDLLEHVALSEPFVEFLTIPAYDHIP